MFWMVRGVGASSCEPEAAANQGGLPRDGQALDGHARGRWDLSGLEDEVPAS